MPKTKEPLTEVEVEAMDLCVSFQRCMNYPRDEDGVIALARGLVRSHRLTQISMDRIVEECLEISMYCPTDSDFLNVARDLRGPEKAEDVPQVDPAEIRKQWQALAHQFPRIHDNGRAWHAQFRLVCAKVRAQMGPEQWLKSSTKEKVRVALEMGMVPQVKPPEKHAIEDMGLGIFVPRLPL